MILRSALDFLLDAVEAPRNALRLLAVLLAGCASGHYVYPPPDPVACGKAVALAALAQVPCDRDKPDSAECVAALAKSLTLLTPCLPVGVWVADPPPLRVDGGAP